MKTPDEIKRGLAACSADECHGQHVGCPYDKTSVRCVMDMCGEALAYIEQLEAREWDLFDLLSSAWFGKRCYFQQDNGTVYSRVSGEYMTLDLAIDEFAGKLTNERESDPEAPEEG